MIKIYLSGTCFLSDRFKDWLDFIKLFSRNIAWIRMRHYCLQIFFEGNHTRLKDLLLYLRIDYSFLTCS
ncbi:hypothetical protein PRO82_001356 [Candidatus Protochlamydia amoebophila]|nr:hypothetical protein [Candidatus Protochlamydia amoebophila]